MKILFLGDSITEARPGVSFVNMVQSEFDEYTCVNRGKGGDTVSSIFRRMKKMNDLSDFDKIVLFVGINDTYGKLSTKYKFTKILSRQKWAKNDLVFIMTYKNLLEYLYSKVKDVIVIPPLVMGEDLSNKWNKEVTDRESKIEVLTRHFDEMTYLDIHNKFYDYLGRKEVVEYLPLSLREVANDVVTLKTNKDVDNKSKERGLHLTLDGCHINSKGASIIAKEIIKTLKKG